MCCSLADVGGVNWPLNWLLFSLLFVCVRCPCVLPGIREIGSIRVLFYFISFVYLFVLVIVVFIIISL